MLRGILGKIHEMIETVDFWLALQAKKADGGRSRQPEEAKVRQNSFIPLIEWPHAWPPLGALRHLAKNRHKRGLDKVFIKIGKRVVIDEAAFFDWVRTHAKQKKIDLPPYTSRDLRL